MFFYFMALCLRIFLFSGLIRDTSKILITRLLFEKMYYRFNFYLHFSERKETKIKLETKLLII